MSLNIEYRAPLAAISSLAKAPVEKHKRTIVGRRREIIVIIMHRNIEIKLKPWLRENASIKFSEAVASAYRPAPRQMARAMHRSARVYRGRLPW